MAQFLLNAPGIDVNAPDNEGWTSLHWAATCGHNGVVRLLLNFPLIERNIRGKNNRTPLHCAVLRVTRMWLMNDSQEELIVTMSVRA